MNILDENIAANQRERLKGWRIPIRQVGYDIKQHGLLDDAIIPFLLELRRPTFFTRDLDFYNRDLCHTRYCLVCLVVGQYEVVPLPNSVGAVVSQTLGGQAHQRSTRQSARARPLQARWDGEPRGAIAYPSRESFDVDQGAKLEMSTPIMTLEQIRVTGLVALMEKLGPDGMIRFLQQFETGAGDYSTGRHPWVDQWDMDTLIKKLREQQSKTM